MRREQVTDQRVGRRPITGFADADAHAHQQKRPETPDQAIDRRQRTPHRQPPPHQAAARASIGHAPQRQASQGIDDGERRADDTQLEIAQVPFHTDRLDDDGRDGAVEEIEQVGQKQQEQDAPGVRRLGRCLHGSVSFIVIQPPTGQEFAASLMLPSLVDGI
ncbi:hypothetical protein D3C85_1178930 [compost metagenome]